MDRWFLLDSLQAPGAENMALDELLLERAQRGGAPVLRLYSFDPPAITIGRHQDPNAALDLEAVRADGVDWVRRPTGGRALLHDGELTYCVATPTRPGTFGSGVTAACRRISEALRDALRSLGVEAEISRGAAVGRSAGPVPPCLSSVTRWELTGRGRKIAGSAQRSTASALMQHGSILLRPGGERIARYVRGLHGALEDRITWVSRELGRDVGQGELRGAIVRSFSETFGAVWEPLSLSADDRADIERRARAKRAELEAFCGREVFTP